MVMAPIYGWILVIGAAVTVFAPMPFLLGRFFRAWAARPAEPRSAIVREGILKT